MTRRHTITTVICLIAVVLIGISTVSIYKQERTHERAVAAENQATETAQAKVHAAVLSNQQAQIKAECVKETTYYDLLTVKQKATVDAPACSLLVQ